MYNPKSPMDEDDSVISIPTWIRLGTSDATTFSINTAYIVSR